MNNNGDINNAIFLNVGSKGFVRFGNRSDVVAGSGDQPEIVPNVDPVVAAAINRREAERSGYRLSIRDAINQTYAKREEEKKKYIENYKKDVEKQNTDKKKEEAKQAPIIAKQKEDFIKPLTEARRNLYENTKKMRYDLTLLEAKYHKYILDNIEDLPKKTEALRKAIIYIRNKKLAQKELSEKQKVFYKNQMEKYLKEWSKFNAKGNQKLQTLRSLYKTNQIIKSKNESKEAIKKELELLASRLIENDNLYEEAKKVKDNDAEIARLAEIVVKLRDTLSRLFKAEVEVAEYIKSIDTLYFKVFPSEKKISVDTISNSTVAADSPIAEAIDNGQNKEGFIIDSIARVVVAGIRIYRGVKAYNNYINANYNANYNDSMSNS